MSFSVVYDETRVSMVSQGTTEEILSQKWEQQDSSAAGGIWQRWLKTKLKMVLFHIAAIGWISPQTGYKIQGSISTQN